MSTIGDVRQCVTSLSGAVILALPTDGPNPFVTEAERLGGQIASENNVDFGSRAFDALPPETPLSNTTESMFTELERVKRALPQIRYQKQRAALPGSR